MTHITLAAMLGGWELILILMALLLPVVIGGAVLVIFLFIRSAKKSEGNVSDSIRSSTSAKVPWIGLIAILLVVVGWFAFRSVKQGSGDRLNQTQFFQAFDSNKIVQAVIYIQPNSPLAQIAGRYKRADDTEAQFATKVRLTDERKNRLLESDNIGVRDGNPVSLGLIWSFFPIVFIGAVLFAVGYLAVRTFKKSPMTTPPQYGSQTVRLRKCPKCGSPLNMDAPEGLCPACLLQHGFATEGGAPAGPTAFVPPSISELARLFPQLEIISLIGKGGMGAVYKARQPALDRIVALKILAPQPGTELDFASRFAREAKALARLNHPNIVGVYDFGVVTSSSESGHTPDATLSYFLMEFVDGPNLRQVEQAGKLSPREALEIIPQICAALQFAHDEGIVHRDIKPENVLLDKKGRVKIADFGLAKILGQEAKDFRLTGAKDVMGTPHYMAPEQVETPQEVDHRADIFSLGVVFYEMLTGELPLGKFAPPSQKVQVDVRLDEIVLRALEKEPRLRYQQASEFKTRVETVANPGSGDPQFNSPGAQENIKPSADVTRQKEPRFSRTAIAGLCLILLSLALLPASVIAVRGAPVVMFFFAMLVLIAALLVTILGWAAVSQIRRSEGRIWGMGLAVFEGLLFPLLALDAALIGLSIFIGLQVKFAGMTVVHSSENVSMLFKFAFLLMVIAGPAFAILVDVLIVKGIWRSVNQPIGITPSMKKPDRFWRRFAIGAACVVCIPIVIAVFGMLAVIVIPNFVKHRAQVQVAAAQQRKQAAMHRLQNIAQNLETNPAAASVESFQIDGNEEKELSSEPVLLSSGDVALELVEIGSLSDSNQLWWRPDGHPTTNVFDSTFHPPMLPTRTIRLPGAANSNLKATHSYTFVFCSKGTSTLPPRLEIGEQTVPLMIQPIFHPPGFRAASSPSMENVYCGNVELPEDQQTADCTLSFSTGPWLIDESIPNFRSGNLTGIKITCGGLNWTVTTRLEETNGAVRLTGSHPLFWSAGWDHQLVLLAGDGSAYRYFTNESSINNGSITRMDVNQTYNNLSFDDVNGVRFRIRPYQQFSVRNISLQSGQFTTVGVTNTTRWKTVPDDFKVEPLSIAEVETNRPQTVLISGQSSVEATNHFIPDTARVTRRQEKSWSRKELSARFEAAKGIFGFSEKDSAMAAVARDAAAAGEAEVAKQALGEITGFSNRDDAARNAARQLAEKGYRNEALEIARMITSYSMRDATLRALADK